VDRTHSRESSDRPLVVVTFAPRDATRSVLETGLAAVADVVFLPDVAASDREATLRRARAVLAWVPTSELSTSELAATKDAGLLQLISAGTDRVPFDEIPAGVAVAGNVGAYAQPMAEHVLAMTLALAKRLPQKHAELARGEFQQSPLNRMIDGSTCGIIGFGGIGQATARRFAALGARIQAINTTGRTDQPVEFCGTLDDLDRVLAASDELVISIPLTKRTHGLIGRRELEGMKKDAILVNVARGDIVDQDALYQHMQEHADFSAAIDTWWDEPFGGGQFKVERPFFDLPNFLGSPHNSAFVPDIDVTAGQAAAENVARFLRGEPVRGVVDPEDY
jgi:phosphoglycerate dehydrogenase-like enzyme